MHIYLETKIRVWGSFCDCISFRWLSLLLLFLALFFFPPFFWWLQAVPVHIYLKTKLLVCGCFCDCIRFSLSVIFFYYRQCKARQASIVKDKRDKQQKVLLLICEAVSLSWLIFVWSSNFLCKQDKRLILTMEDLSKALREVGKVSNIYLF